MAGVAHAAGGAGTLLGQFSVDPAGAATYRIPIHVVPGANGLQPSLALLYNSRKGRGIAGYGWSLKGLSAISRCAATKATFGAARPVDPINHTNGPGSDKFCLDGQALLAPSAAYGANGTEYHTEIATFQRVISHGAQGHGPAWFEIQDKAGLTREYGHTADSLISGDPEAYGGASGVVWNIDKISDRNGNYITFTYDTEHRIQKIDYYNNANALLGGVHFAYSNTSASHVGFFAGAELIHDSALSEINVFSGGTSSNDLTRKYIINTYYDKARRVTRLDSIQECSGDGSCFPATKFTYTDPGDPGFVNAKIKLIYKHLDHLHYADIDGDGRVDLVYVDDGSWKIRFARNFYNTVTPTGITTSGQHLDNVQVFDYNGDGRQDLLIRTKQHQFEVAKSTGTGLALTAGVADSGLLTDCGNDYKHFATADLDGDGLPEILFKCVDHLAYYHDTATGYDTSRVTPLLFGGEIAIGDDERLVPINVNGDSRADLYLVANGCSNCRAGVLVTINGSGRPADFSQNTDLSFGGGRAIFADLNGDGLDDAAVYGRYLNQGKEWQIWINRGGYWKGLGTPDGSDPINQYAPENNSAALVLDYNYDGRADLLVPTSSNGKWTALSLTLSPYGDHKLQGGFYATATPIVYNSSAVPIVADYYGTGNGDFIYGDDSGVYLHDALGGNFGPNYLLNHITNGLGAQLTIQYCSIAHTCVDYTPSTTGRSNNGEVRNFGGALYVVAKIVTDDGQGDGNNLRTSYAYVGAKMDQWGRGFLGFQQVKATNSGAGIPTTTTTTAYRLAFPYTGLATASQRQRSGDPGPYTRTLNTLAQLDTGRGVFPYVHESATTAYTPGSATAYKKVTTSSTYDKCGNAIETEVSTVGSGNPAYTVDTVNTYSDNTVSGPCLGRLINTKVIHTLNRTSRTRESSFSYAASGQLKSTTVEPGDAHHGYTTVYGFNRYGNRASKTISADGIARRVTTIGYRPDGRFPSSIADPLGHASSTSWDARRGVKLSTTGSNGLTIHYAYDGFGRKIGSSGPYPAAATTLTYDRRRGGGYRITQTRAGGGSIITKYDDKGRKVQTITTGLHNQLIYQDFHYDVLGRRYLVSAPYHSGETRCWKYTSFDVLNRPTAVYQAANDDECAAQGGSVPPAGSPPSGYSRVVRMRYNGLTSTITDPKANQTVREDNLLGKVVNVTDAQGNTTNYTYWSAGNIKSKTLPNGAKTTMRYDVMGNKIETDSSTAGVWTYSYDPLGELISQTGPNGFTTTQSYDKLGRMTRRVQPNVAQGGSITTHWIYDKAAHGIGKLAEESKSTGFDRDYTYTAYAQLLTRS